MTTPTQGIKRIVVGLDGSDHAAAALDWAINAARPIGAEIVAVSALHVPAYPFDEYAIAYPLEFDPEWRAAIKKAFEEEWCKPLRESGLRYRMEMQEGRPALSSPKWPMQSTPTWSSWAGGAAVVWPSYCWAASATNCLTTASGRCSWSRAGRFLREKS